MKLMKVNLAAMAFALVAITACEPDDETEIIENSGWSETDQNFVAQTNEQNRAAIELGILAVANGSNVGVKTFAQMTADEHNEALEDLQVIANDQDVALSNDLSAEHQQLRARLMGLSGFAFDTVYINSRIKAHNSTIALFENQLDHGEDQRLINYATEYLPRVRFHLREADSLKVVLDNSLTGG